MTLLILLVETGCFTIYLGSRYIVWLVVKQSDLMSQIRFFCIIILKNFVSVGTIQLKKMFKIWIKIFNMFFSLKQIIIWMNCTIKLPKHIGLVPQRLWVQIPAWETFVREFFLRWAPERWQSDFFPMPRFEPCPLKQ